MFSLFNNSYGPVALLTQLNKAAAEKPAGTSPHWGDHLSPGTGRFSLSSLIPILDPCWGWGEVPALTSALVNLGLQPGCLSSKLQE